MKGILALNSLALAFSGWWLSAHVMRGKVGDWEFWFALGFLILCAINVAYLAKRSRQA